VISKQTPIVISGFLALLFITSCSNHSKGITSPSASSIKVDCTGYTADMIIPYGLTIGTSAQYANKKFAKLVAVDKGTGEMEITIQAPDGGTFSQDFIDSFKDYKLRIIACRESVSGLTGGINAKSACSSTGSINLVGKEGLTYSDLSTGVYMVDANTIHATTVPTFDSSHNLLRPNFIMLTAGLIDTNPIGEFMIAFGRSPYYNGCYTN